MGRSIGLGLVPVTADASTLLALHDIATELEAILGIPLEIHTASSPRALEEDFASGKTQLVWSSPVLALSSPHFRSAVPMVCSVRQGVAYYHSVLLVGRASPIGSVLALRGTKVAWVARTSASGYIFPRIALAGQGIDPATLFAHEAFLGAHGAVVEAVRSGEADACATFAVFEQGDATRTLLRAGHHDVEGASGALRVLLATPPIPSDLFVAAQSLHDDHGPLLTKALETLATRTPRALQTAFGAEALVATTEKELTDLRRQLADAQAMGLFDPA